MAEKPKAAPKPPVATTHYVRPNGKTWEVWRVLVAEDGSLKQERVLSNPSRLIARERLIVLNEGVLP